MTIEYLSRAVDRGYADYDRVKNDSDLDNIRDDRRFEPILTKLKDRTGSRE